MSTQSSTPPIDNNTQIDTSDFIFQTIPVGENGLPSGSVNKNGFTYTVSCVPVSDDAMEMLVIVRKNDGGMILQKSYPSVRYKESNLYMAINLICRELQSDYQNHIHGSTNAPKLELK